jgi:Domain of unknown function (DUF4136)
MSHSGLRRLTVALVVLAVVSVGGCSTYGSGPDVTYLYEPLYSFTGLKTYRWAEARPASWSDPLVESNVRFLADRALEAKGLTSKTDKPDLVISISYGPGYADELRSLILSVARADRNELVWRGMASGPIRTDAASTDLKNAVEGILANFPPK